MTPALEFGRQAWVKSTQFAGPVCEKCCRPATQRLTSDDATAASTWHENLSVRYACDAHRLQLAADSVAEYLKEIDTVSSKRILTSTGFKVVIYVEQVLINKIVQTQQVYRQNADGVVMSEREIKGFGPPDA